MAYMVNYYHPALGFRHSSVWGCESDANRYKDSLPESWNPVVTQTALLPEIFRHCGPKDDQRNPSQAIGGKCFWCGVVLTREHAKQFARENA